MVEEFAKEEGVDLRTLVGPVTEKGRHELHLHVILSYWLDECSEPLRRDYTRVARAASPLCRAEPPERIKNGYGRDTGASSRLALVSGPQG